MRATKQERDREMERGEQRGILNGSHIEARAQARARARAVKPRTPQRSDSFAAGKSSGHCGPLRSMTQSVDYKWRKRMCRKWQEEQQQQQQKRMTAIQSEITNAAVGPMAMPLILPPHLAENRNCSSFLDDPSGMRKLFLTRRSLLLMSQLPDFQRLVRGCFVRVRFGEVYHVAQIQSIGIWRPSSEPTLILRIDNHPRVFSLAQLTNAYFSRGELLHWRYNCHRNSFVLPTKRLVEQKHQELIAANLRVQQQLCDPQLKLNQELMHESQLHTNLPDKSSSNSSSSSSSSSSSNSISSIVAAPPQAKLIKYLVEPMECYRQYLPTTLPITAPTVNSNQPQELTTAICPKKKISLDEYRERCIKKNSDNNI